MASSAEGQLGVDMMVEASYAGMIGTERRIELDRYLS